MLLYILVLFCLVCHIYLQGGTTPLFYFLFCGILLFYVLCYLSLSFFSLSAHLDYCYLLYVLYRSMYVSYPVRWHAIAMPTLLTALQCTR